MKELMEYRSSLIDRLLAVTEEFSDTCRTIKDAFTPLDGSTWTLHQVAAHVRDVEKLVYGERARRTAVEDNPEFHSFDGEAYMAEHYSTREPLEDILNELRSNVGSLTTLLRKLPTEAWSRESRHLTFGNGFTVQTWVERDLAHIEEHLETLKKNT